MSILLILWSFFVSVPLAIGLLISASAGTKFVKMLFWMLLFRIPSKVDERFDERFPPPPRLLYLTFFFCFATFLSHRGHIRYLQRRIQDSEAGHNSAEDAIAALELAQLKISKGPNFGAERSTDSVFDRLHR